MDKGLEKKIVFFGCPLDGDERHESIQEKLSLMGTPGSRRRPLRRDHENHPPGSEPRDLVGKRFPRRARLASPYPLFNR